MPLKFYTLDGKSIGKDEIGEYMERNEKTELLFTARIIPDLKNYVQTYEIRVDAVNEIMAHVLLEKTPLAEILCVKLLQSLYNITTPEAKLYISSLYPQD